MACGEPSEGTRCDRCAPQFVNHQRPNKTRPREAGYDTTWDKLSKRARSRQDWCTDCGSPYDLTADHSPEAWERKAAGLPIRLRDIDVVCRRCNTDRGKQRPADPGGITAGQSAGSPRWKAKSRIHLGIIVDKDVGGGP